MNAKTFDETWEQLYAAGTHLNRYPWDAVVSFVFHNRPRDKTPAETRILEVGCGTGSNLWFAAREGFAVAGADGSRSAIAYARKRFDEDRLSGDLQVMDFTAPYPWPDNHFDLAIDRCSLVSSGMSGAQKAIRNVNHVLKAGGRFLSIGYASENIGLAKAKRIDDGLYTDLSAGPLQGIGQLCFWSEEDVRQLYDPHAWKIVEMSHIAHVSCLDQDRNLFMWHTVAEKVA